MSKFMPVMHHRNFLLPWEVIARHEKQAVQNHGQTLDRLAERGGLSTGEAVAIMEDRRWHESDFHSPRNPDPDPNVEKLSVLIQLEWILMSEEAAAKAATQ